MVLLTGVATAAAAVAATATAAAATSSRGSYYFSSYLLLTNETHLFTKTIKDNYLHIADSSNLFYIL